MWRFTGIDLGSSRQVVVAGSLVRGFFEIAISELDRIILTLDQLNIFGALLGIEHPMSRVTDRLVQERVVEVSRINKDLASARYSASVSWDSKAFCALEVGKTPLLGHVGQLSGGQDVDIGIGAHQILHPGVEPVLGRIEMVLSLSLGSSIHLRVMAVGEVVNRAIGFITASDKE